MSDIAWMYSLYLDPDLHPLGCTCGCGEAPVDEKRCTLCGEYMEYVEEVMQVGGEIFLGYSYHWNCVNPDCDRNA